MTTSNIYSLADTWNASGTTFDGIKLNVTNTASAAASRLLRLQVGGADKFAVDVSGNIQNGLAGAGTRLQFGAKSMVVDSGNANDPGDINVRNVTLDWDSKIALRPIAAGVMGVTGSSATTPAAMELYTYGASPPAAPAASKARIYVDTSGAKARLMVLFPTGAAQQVAIEP